MTARTNKYKVYRRLGINNIDADVDEETLDEYITDASAFIERYAQTTHFDSNDTDLVESIATDLVVAMVCEHMAGGKYYGGADYRIGPWTTTKSTGGQQLLMLAKRFRDNANSALKVLGNSSSFRFATG